MNQFTGFLGPKGRKTVCLAYAVVGGTQAALAVYGMADVKWLVATMSVYSFLGGAFGLVAGNDVPSAEPDSAEDAESDETPPSDGYEPRH